MVSVDESEFVYTLFTLQFTTVSGCLIQDNWEFLIFEQDSTLALRLWQLMFLSVVLQKKILNLVYNKMIIE